MQNAIVRIVDGEPKLKWNRYLQEFHSQRKTLVLYLHFVVKGGEKGSFSKYASSKKLELKYYSAEGKGSRHFPSKTFL